LTLDDLSLPSPDKYRPLRHQYSTDNVHVPAFNIPNLRIEQRKTSSAEDMARKNSIGANAQRNVFPESVTSPDSFLPRDK
jgi:SCY1-like protein 2